MRKVIVVCVLFLSAALLSQPAHAIKPFGDAFKDKYASDENKNEEFKALVKKANCNVCHINKENKKVRNPYGEAAHKEGLSKKEYDKLKAEDLAKATQYVVDTLKKAEALKAEGEEKTFGKKIEEGKLPGGDVEGKPEKGRLISFTSEDAGKKSDFVSLADGKSFDGWKINENKGVWSIEDGAFVCQGDRSHLFYVGDGKPFKNFHFKVEVKTKPNANGGIYFHTKFQETGWPKYGFECQVNNTYTKDPKKTSGLYGVKDVFEPAAKDDVWYTQEIIVQGKKVTLKVDGKTIVEYDEPADAKAGKDFTRVLDEGTFAFQSHDPGSRVYYRNPQVKRLD